MNGTTRAYLVGGRIGSLSAAAFMIRDCRMPYITSTFMPRAEGDRPLPVPRSCRNLAFVSQFVEIPDDVVFTVEYSVRAAQMAVYELLKVEREMPPIHRYDKSLKVKLDAVIKAFR